MKKITVYVDADDATANQLANSFYQQIPANVWHEIEVEDED